ncbi:cytochrome C oxidase subunit II [Robertmurraya yapensis]|uniref:Cytochrome C oxidase subunit II n=1 Tax=Bacillus yapensis TaxID=2492960 RepID=A0A3S0K205_9BACI|nr:cupredoxin domain-containing protein [Bacillus yapensis]RTR33921.1 cytochrome C oxidase subunit II [Bacillus yapensis]TKS97239.1 cytochrome C oxidase subunit II [Bacillus yapensis]
MKKLGVLLLAGSLTLGLAACGGEEKETKTSEPAASESTSTSGAEEFTITATNWEFTSDKELTVKKGTNVKINLVNEEGLHTISNEDLGIDLKADSPSEFTADTAGEYELICSTVCGATEDHEAMKLTLKVVE